jgi:ribosomal protein S18 acetylase RimI-like enzyme
MVLRLGGSEVLDRGDHLVVRTPANPSFYWGNFLLVARPLGTGETARWLDRFTKEFPEATHRAIGIDTVNGDAGDVDDVAAAGLDQEINTVLVADSLPEPPTPETEIREVRSGDDWHAVNTVRCAVYGVPGSPAEADFQRRKLLQSRAVTETGRGAWYGAFVAGRMVASLGIVADGTGLARYQSVETHPDFQRRGIGRRLLYDASKYAIDHLGATCLVIVADPDGNAIRLYRSAGFADAERQVQLLNPSSGGT